ncbi:carboxypeptidase regulatory-like domain-containing protein, partial [bacterium]|nr:carboxypeptidase regulatory-like domain-containing protein [bacterium]
MRLNFRIFFLIVLTFSFVIFIAFFSEYKSYTYADYHQSCYDLCRADPNLPSDEDCAISCDTTHSYHGCAMDMSFIIADEGDGYGYCDSHNDNGKRECSEMCYFDEGLGFSACLDWCTTGSESNCQDAYEVIHGPGTYFPPISPTHDFCGEIITPPPDFTDPIITLDQDFYLRSTTGSVAITGDVTDNIDVDAVNLYSVDSTNTTPCTLFGIYPNQTFSCDTENLTTDQSYKFEVKATDTATNEAVEDVLVEVDVVNGEDLVALWRFDDDVDWLKDDINSMSSTNHSATQSSDGYTTDSLDGAPGYVTISDASGLLSFDENDSQLTVEAWVKKWSFVGSYTRVAGKNNTANTENTWLIGTDNNGGVYCAVWIDGVQESIATGNLGGSSVFLNAGDWNRIGCKWNAEDRSLKAYVNGSEAYSRILAGTANIASSSSDFAIGARPNGGDPFGGLIDNVKVYEKVIVDIIDPTITLDQDFYLRSTTGSVTITGDVTDDVDVNAVNLYSVDSTNTTPCTLSGVYPNQTFSCDTENLTTDQSYKFEVKATDTATNEAVEDVLVEVDVDNDKDLVALWRFDDDTDWLLEDINNMTPTNHSAIQSNDGYTTDSLDSTPGYVTIDDSAELLSFDQDNSAFMVEAMVKNDNYSGGYSRIAGKYNEANTDNNWLVGTNNSAQVYCAIWIDGHQHLQYSTATLNVDQWYSVGCKWSSGDRQLRVYIDGVEDSALDLSKIEGEISSSTKDFAIGARATGGDSFEGLIDNVKIYSFNVGDGKAPKITFEPIDDPSAITDTTPTISGSITDPDICEYAEYLVLDVSFLDGSDDIDNYTWTEFLPADGVWNSIEEDFEITLDEFAAEGGYHIYIRARDVYENSSFYLHNGWIINFDIDSDYIMANRMFTLEFVDNSPPTIEPNEVQPNPSIDRNLDIRGYVEDYIYDTRSEISTIEYSLDGGSWQSVTILTSSSDGFEKEFFIDLSDLSIAEHTVRIKASDASGNETADDYQVCFDDCMDTGLQDEEMCECSCDSHKKKSIQTVEFEIVEADVPESALEDYDISFEDDSSVDGVNTSSVVGRSRIRLPLDYDFDLEKNLYTNEEEFGSLYGQKLIGVDPALDGNLWLAFNDGTFGYYNISADILVRYPAVWGEVVKIIGITEFEHGGNKFLALELHNDYPLTIYSIGNTITDTSDDSYSNYSILLGVNSSLRGIQIDNRGTYPCFYAIIANNSLYGPATAEVMWVDTQGTIDNLADDSVTTWDTGDGIGVDHVSLLFDEARNRFVAGDYGSQEVSYCDDRGTPSNMGDDVCDMSSHNYGAGPIFDILVDNNGWYWFAGDNGVSATYVEDIATLASSGYFPYFSNEELGSQRAYRIAWVDNVEKHTEELLISTREGSLLAFDYNGTYSDFLDDRVTSFTFPGELYGAYVAYDMMFDDLGETAWLMMPGSGLYSVDIARSFQPESDVLIWPEVQPGDVSVDHFTLNSITGSFVENIDAFVSNDNGVSWYPVEIGDTVDFPTSDCQVRVKLVLNKVGEDTPLVLGISMSYATYGEDPFVTSDLNIDYPPVSTVGGEFDTEVIMLDDLGLIPNWNGEIEVDAYRAIGGGDANYCFEFDIPTEIVSGESVIGTTAFCSGTFTISATTDDGRSVMGSNIVVSGFGTEDLCGNGVLDDGEECDPEIEEDLPLCLDMDERYVSGSVTCSNICEYEYAECEEEDTIFTPLVDLITEVDEDGEVSWNLERITSLATGVVALSLLFASLNTLPYYLMRALIGLLNLFKRKKAILEYGFVYNSLTKEPVARAIVRVIDSNGKVVETIVTGKYGEFYGDLEPANYTLSVRKPGFDFPSSIITTPTDRNIDHVYTGSLQISSGDVEAIVAIPIDPIDSSFIKRLRIGLLSRSSVWIMLLRFIIFIGLMIYSVIICLQEPSVINLLIVAIYGLLSIFLVINSFEKRIRYGVVTDQEGKPLEGVQVVLKEVEFNEIVGERITDEKGRYRFVIVPGDYSLSIVSNGESLSGGEIEQTEKSPMIINMDVVLK